MKEVNLLPRNKYPEETVQKILDVSMKLFVEKGYEQTTVLDIVSNLGGLTRGAFYHHFKSKEDVFFAISDKMFRDHNPFEALKGRDDLNGLEKLRQIFLSRTDILDEPENADYISFHQIGISLLTQPHFLAEQLKSNQMIATILSSFIEEGMSDGSIRPGDPKLLAELIIILFNVWMLPSLFPMTMDEFEKKSVMIGIALDALGCPVMNEGFDDSVGETFAKILGIEDV